MYHVPNGGYRSKKTAMMLKGEGVKSGVPDIVLPVARGGYHGLYIELKVGKNKPTDNQKKFMAALNDQDYLAIVCWGFEEARAAITEYLKIGGM